jgi:acyl-CoA oxidase
VPLTDAFNLPDLVLHSPFGRYDGDVYPHYFAAVNAASERAAAAKL